MFKTTQKYSQVYSYFQSLSYAFKRKTAVQEKISLFSFYNSEVEWNKSLFSTLSSASFHIFLRSIFLNFFVMYHIAIIFRHQNCMHNCRIIVSRNLAGFLKKIFVVLFAYVLKVY